LPAKFYCYKFDPEPDDQTQKVEHMPTGIRSQSSNKIFQLNTAMGTFSEPLIINLSFQSQKGNPVKRAALFFVYQI
jgi:hypothetical protein